MHVYIFFCMFIIAVEEFYKKKENYREGMVQICDTFAAYYLAKLFKSLDNFGIQGLNKSQSDDQVSALEVVKYLRLADGIDPMCEFSALLKGFYGFWQQAYLSVNAPSAAQSGADYSRAEKYFMAILNKASGGGSTAGETQSKLAYAAHVGMVSGCNLGFIYFFPHIIV